MELGIINDLLMDAYFEVRYKQSSRARITLAKAIVILYKIKKDSSELELLFDIIQGIRNSLKRYHSQEGISKIIMEDISHQIRKVRTWEINKAA